MKEAAFVPGPRGSDEEREEKAFRGQGQVTPQNQKRGQVWGWGAGGVRRAVSPPAGTEALGPRLSR